MMVIPVAEVHLSPYTYLLVTAATIITADAVSYTHLDVYKRQGQAKWCSATADDVSTDMYNCGTL